MYYYIIILFLVLLKNKLTQTNYREKNITVNYPMDKSVFFKNGVFSPHFYGDGVY